MNFTKQATVRFQRLSFDSETQMKAPVPVPDQFQESMYDFNRDVSAQDLFHKTLYRCQERTQPEAKDEGSDSEEKPEKSQMLKDLELAVKRLNVFT